MPDRSSCANAGEHRSDRDGGNIAEGVARPATPQVQNESSTTSAARKHAIQLEVNQAVARS